MPKKIVVGYARTGSRRLPNKVIYDLGGKPAFVQIMERVTHYLKADRVIVACTRDAMDDPIELLAKHHGIECFRGALSIQPRALALGEKLGLQEDDWWIGVHCDGPLKLTEWMPWAIEQAEKHGCDHIFMDLPRGTLAAGFWAWNNIKQWGLQRRAWETKISIDELGGAGLLVEGFHLGVRKYLIVHLPPEYLISWPYGLLFLDHPAQALVLKEIYRQLYKGKPIDPFDVHDLFLREPYLAQVIPLSLPLAKQPVMPGGEQDSKLAGIRLNAEFIEVTWKRD